MDLSKLFGDGNFLLGVISFVVTLASAIFAIWSYFRSRQRKLITYEFEDRDINVVSIDRDQGENIKILLDDIPVREVRYQLIQIRNEGNVAVDSDDYKKPLQITFSPRQDTSASGALQFVVRAGIPEAAPSLGISGHNARDYIILDQERQYVALKDVLLNAGDWIRIKVLTLGKADIAVTGQIKDGLIRQYVPPPSIFKRRNIVYYVLSGGLLFFLVFNSINLITAFGQGRCALGNIKVGGSSAFFETAHTYAASYHSACPVGNVDVSQESSSSGLSDLKADKIQIADSEKPAAAEGLDTTGYDDNQVAVIVFTVVTNKEVTGISSLTVDQLRQIYRGDVTRWNQLKDARGPDLPIKVFGRSSTSGTHTAFTSYVLGQELNSAPTYHEEDKTANMADAVANTPGAIGYVDVGTAVARNDKLSIISIGTIPPQNALVQNNKYPFWAIEHMYTKKNPDALSKSFVTYVTNNIQTNNTFVRISDMAPGALSSHQQASS